MTAAKKYKLHAFSKSLLSCVHLDNLQKLFVAAHQAGCTELMETYLSIIDEKAEIIMSQHKINDRDFPQWNREILFEVLKRDTLNATEDVIIDFVGTWAEKEMTRRGMSTEGKDSEQIADMKAQILGDVVGLIRFDLLEITKIPLIHQKHQWIKSSFRRCCWPHGTQEFTGGRPENQRKYKTSRAKKQVQEICLFFRLQEAKSIIKKLEPKEKPDALDSESASPALQSQATCMYTPNASLIAGQQQPQTSLQGASFTYNQLHVQQQISTQNNNQMRQDNQSINVPQATLDHYHVYPQPLPTSEQFIHHQIQDHVPRQHLTAHQQQQHVVRQQSVSLHRMTN
jgi:hypothetical protein